VSLPIDPAGVHSLTGRAFFTNVPSLSMNGTSWRDLCKKINPGLYTHGPPVLEDDGEGDESDGSSLKIETDDRVAEVNGAVDLLEHLLDPDSTRRYTAKDALNHPWLRSDNPVDYDDQFFPHPIQEGACADFHYVDEANSHVVGDVAGSVRRQLVAGEGIAIGFAPCEFHAQGKEDEDP